MNSSYRDQIMYIDLNGVNPTTTTARPTPSTDTETPESSSTDQDQTTPACTTETPICPPEGVHSFPFPGNCTLYIKCFEGVEQVLSCAPLIFDKVDRICKSEAEAVCDEEDPPNQCPPDSYVTMPHSSNCSLYYECFNGNRYESECAPHAYFDANLDILRCNNAELALCYAECPATGIEFQPIRSIGCQWYKVCLDGVSANLQCGGGELFSSIESKCVPVGEYNCPY